MDIRSVGNMVPSGPIEKSSVEPTVVAKPTATAVATAAAVEQPAPPPSLAQVTQAVKSINQAMQALSQNVEFSVDSDSNRTIVKVVDQQTKEVLRQMPSAEALEIAKALDQALPGLLIKQKA